MDQLFNMVAVYITRPKSLPGPSASAGTLTNIVNAILSTFGAIAVLIIALSGFKYVTSRGDPQAVAKAKDTMLYAILGLVVSVLAYGIVGFVIPKVTK